MTRLCLALDAKSHALTFALLGSFSCADGALVLLPKGFETWAIVALIDEEDEITRAFLAKSGDRWTQPEEEAVRAAIWPLHAGDFVSAEGRAISEEAIGDAHVRLAADPVTEPTFGSCGRCLAPWGSAPQPVFSGDSCAPPSFLQAELWEVASGELLSIEGESKRTVMESARQRVRLDWPGACPCLREPPDLSGDLEVASMITETQDRWPLLALAVSPDGAFAGFAQHYALVVTQDGSRFELERPMLFPFSPRTAVALAPRSGSSLPRFAVSAADPSYLLRSGALDPNEKILVEIEGSELTLRPLALLGHDPRKVLVQRFVRLPEGRVAVLGQGLELGSFGPLGRTPFASLCTAHDDGLQCESQLDLAVCMESTGDFALDTALLSSGSQAVLLTGGLAIAESGSRSVSCVTRLDRLFGRNSDPRALSAVNNRIFLCTGGPDGGRVATTSVSNAADISDPGKWTMSLELQLPAVNCRLATYTDPGSGRLAVRVVTQTSIAELDADGQVISPLRPIQDVHPELRAAHALLDADDGTIFGLAGWDPILEDLEYPPIAWTQSIFRRRALEASFELVYGRSSYAFDVNFLLPWRDELVAIHAGPDLVFARVSLSTNSTVSRAEVHYPEEPEGLEAGVAFLDATVDSSVDSVIAVGHRYAEGDRGVVLRLWPDRSLVEWVSSSTELGAVRAIAEITPGRFVLGTTSGQSYWLEGDDLNEIIPAAQDPYTLASPVSTVESIDAALGVAWVAGGTTLQRILPPSELSARPRAETFDLLRADPELGAISGPRPLVHVICPDQMVLSNVFGVFETSPVTVSDRSVSGFNTTGEYRLSRYGGLPLGPLRGFGAPVAAGSQGSRLTFLGETGLVIGRGRFQPRVPFHPRSAAIDRAGRLVIGGYGSNFATSSKVGAP